ncbi:helix-turn-helix domain-containing protein [Roseicitreum antarcticum]|uniref:AraC family transcriptional regulator, ethanolamine operon transcriptional activator n=1 Tax=Roseicitreum antarcticum TaxID=564137 RepID=A0A1H3FJS8_9RHOB|nr:helix-turn-helix domain-containing protein [Roseicitreum antarcticum]SDX90404.1 AraC family transcriptional regulator, ethanolamine operon transcriptional activator [Roseicitreum antarcticum]
MILPKNAHDPCGRLSPHNAANCNGLYSARIDDAGMQAAMQPWIEMECFQLSPGQQVAELQSLDLSTQQIVRERQHAAVQKLGATPSNLCTLSYCTPEPGLRFSDHRGAREAEIFLMPENTEFDIFVPEGAQTTYISLDQEAFLQAARALNPRHWENMPQQVSTFSTVYQAAFEKLVSGWFVSTNTAAASGCPPDTRFLGREIFQAVLYLVNAATPDDSTPPSGGRAYHICRKAQAFVEDRIDAENLPSVADLCAATGVSERSLQYAFRDYVGMSPLAYLKVRRMNEVRTVLLHNEPEATSVTDIAMQFGFGHLGRFAGDYKRLFGETPSTTLAS